MLNAYPLAGVTSKDEPAVTSPAVNLFTGQAR